MLRTRCRKKGEPKLLITLKWPHIVPDYENTHVSDVVAVVDHNCNSTSTQCTKTKLPPSNWRSPIKMIQLKTWTIVWPSARNKAGSVTRKQLHSCLIIVRIVQIPPKCLPFVSVMLSAVDVTAVPSLTKGL